MGMSIAQRRQYIVTGMCERASCSIRHRPDRIIRDVVVRAAVTLTPAAACAMPRFYAQVRPLRMLVRAHEPVGGAASAGECQILREGGIRGGGDAAAHRYPRVAAIRVLVFCGNLQ